MENHLMSHPIFPPYPDGFIFEERKESLQPLVSINVGGGCVMAAATVNH